MYEESYSWFFGEDAKKIMDEYSYSTPPRKCLNIYFEKQAPAIYYLAWDINDEVQYWKAIKECVLALTGEEVEPKAYFTSFIETIYHKKEFFKPKTFDQVYSFILKCAKRPLSTFLLVTCPLMTQNPMLIIEIVSEMKFRQHKMFNEFQNEKGAVEKMFDLYLSFLDLDRGNYSSDTWNLRLIVADILVSAINNYADSLVLVEQHVSYLHQKLLSLIQIAGPYVVVPFVRLMIQFHKETLQRTHVEFASKRLISLLTAVPTGTPAHAMVMTFIVQSYLSFVPKSEIIRIVTLQNYNNTWDMRNVKELLEDCDEETVFKAVKYLSRTMCLSFCWSRSAGVILASILSKYEQEIDPFSRIQKWFTSFLDQIEVSKILQSHQNKYKTRRRRLGELLNSPIFQDIPFVRDYIENQNASSIEFIELLYSIKQDKEMVLKLLPFNQRGFLIAEKENVVPKKPCKGKGKVKKSRPSSAPNLVKSPKTQKNLKVARGKKKSASSAANLPTSPKKKK